MPERPQSDPQTDSLTTLCEAKRDSALCRFEALPSSPTQRDPGRGRQRSEYSGARGPERERRKHLDRNQRAHGVDLCRSRKHTVKKICGLMGISRGLSTLTSRISRRRHDAGEIEVDGLREAPVRGAGSGVVDARPNPEDEDVVKVCGGHRDSARRRQQPPTGRGSASYEAAVKAERAWSRYECGMLPFPTASRTGRRSPGAGNT